MDLKALIAKMDLIESKQILNELVYEGGMDELAAELGQIANDEDYDKLYDLLSDDGPVGAYLQDKIQDITGETGLHPKDDFEQIESILMDIVKQEFGGQNDDEGGETDDNYAMTSAGFGSDEDYESVQYEDQAVRFKSNIAQALLKEFGLDEKITLNPDGSVPPTQTVGGTKMNTPAVKNPYQGADAAKFAAMTPADQAFLTKGGGVPDINDQFILARAPNKGKSALPAGMTQAQVDQAKNAEEPDAVAKSATAPSTVPAGINPETGEKYDSVASAPLQLPPGAEPEAGTTVAGAPDSGAATKPAAAKPAAAKDPAVIKLQQDLIAKGAKIQADGVMGPQTQAAVKQFGSTPDPVKLKRFKELLAKVGGAGAVTTAANVPSTPG